jgi:hypothetical protein
VAALGKAMTCRGVGDGIWWRVDSDGGSSVRAQEGPAAAGGAGRWCDISGIWEPDIVH